MIATANPMIATANPMIAIANPRIEEDLKEALARANVDATGHMDKRLLEKEQYLANIKQRRDLTDLPIVTDEDRR